MPAAGTYELHFHYQSGPDVLINVLPQCEPSINNTWLQADSADSVVPLIQTALGHPEVSPTTPTDNTAAGLSAQQRTLAIQIARRMASGADPNSPGRVRRLTSWPSYVDTVAATVLPYQQAIDQLDGQGSADLQLALVVRLTGRFATITTGPPGHGPATGNVMTAVVSLESGSTTDSGITTELRPKPLPQQTLLYRR